VSGEANSFAGAEEIVPLELSAFQLPPFIPVSQRDASLASGLKRETISIVLGGSHKTTFPYPKVRTDGPTYACLKEFENHLLPTGPGKHGIVVVKAMPESLVL
jgi:hypothetical protein